MKTERSQQTTWKYNNLEEIDKFLEKYNFPKLNHENRKS